MIPSPENCVYRVFQHNGIEHSETYLYTVGPVIIEFPEYWIATIYYFFLQSTDLNRSTNIKDDKRQKLNCAFKFPFGQRTNHREPKVPL